MNSQSEHATLSEFINTHCIEAFSEELVKRFHTLRMNTHPLAELPAAKRG